MGHDGGFRRLWWQVPPWQQIFSLYQNINTTAGGIGRVAIHLLPSYTRDLDLSQDAKKENQLHVFIWYAGEASLTTLTNIFERQQPLFRCVCLDLESYVEWSSQSVAPLWRFPTPGFFFRLKVLQSAADIIYMLWLHHHVMGWCLENRKLSIVSTCRWLYAISHCYGSSVEGDQRLMMCVCPRWLRDRNWLTWSGTDSVITLGWLELSYVF